jgi:hypothetical protein
VQELVDTEKTYQSDMNVLNEVYYEGACQADEFKKPDIRQLFSNLEDIIELESTFVVLLESSYKQDTIGTTFRETVNERDTIKTKKKFILDIDACD